MFPIKRCLVLFLIMFLSCCKDYNNQKKQPAIGTPGKDLLRTVHSKLDKHTDSIQVTENKSKSITIDKRSKSVLAHASVQTPGSLNFAFKQIEPSFQLFTLNPDSDTTIVCTQGTVLKIQRSGFEFASGLGEVNKSVVLKVKEFYRLSDILAARLTTHSEDSILETGGMLYIEAISENRLCKIKDSSPIQVSFPTSAKKEGMQLFSGSWTNQQIDWQLIASDNIPNKANHKETATFPGGDYAFNRYLHNNLVYPNSLAEMGKAGIVYIDFEIDETGKARLLRFENPSYNAFKEAVQKAFLKMPRWNPAKQNGIPIRSTFSQAITFSSEGQDIDDPAFKQDLQKVVNDSTINHFNTADLRYYIFSTTQLGWINCDRFYASPKPRVDLIVDCGKYTELDIKIVFHSFKAVWGNYTPNSTFKFQNIPDDEAITVVVIKKVQNDTFLSVTQSNTSSRFIRNLVFEKLTMSVLQQRLEQMNTNW